MPNSFISVHEAVKLLDAKESFPGVWLAKCPSCDRESQLAISETWDQKVALGCQVGCTDKAVNLAVEAIWNRTGAITVTGTVAATPSPSGVGVGDPIPVSTAETTTGTVTVPTAKVGVADPTPDSGTQTASGSFPEPPQATVIVGPIAPPLAGDHAGLPADIERGYQWLSPLGDADYVALRESIETFGVMVPVVVDEHGSVIDGYHRVKVCLELGIDWPRTVLSGLSEAEKWDRARDLNDARRHLTASQRKAVLIRLNERMQGKSLRLRAGKLGLSRETVRRMDAQSASGLLSDTPEPEAFRTGTDGKQYRATRLRQESTSGPPAGSVSVTVPEVDQSPPVSGDGIARVSVDTNVSTELVANSPDLDVSPPAAVRLPLFATEEPATAEHSPVLARKAGKGAGKRSPADFMARTTDLTKIVSQLGEWLDFAGINALISLLQDESRRQSIRVVPNPGQTSFI